MAEDAGMFLGVRAEYWARRLTALPSVTGTTEEAIFSNELISALRDSPAFQDDPATVWRLPVPGGPHPRSIVLALLRGKGPRTIMLTGHFDTVEVECYGALRHAARDPDYLAAGLLAALKDEAPDAQRDRALSDLRSGDFIPGRGLLDMKAGLAAALAVMEKAATDPDRTGNLLFVAVPDEEGNSAGARRFAAVRASLEADFGLQIEAAINLDSVADDGDGMAGQVVALGSVGKLLPSALVVGRSVHAGYAFRGFGAPALAGALAAALEWLPTLTPRTGDELGSPPTLLGMRDSKHAYDVTTPRSVWMFWNVALHRGSPNTLLEVIAETARSTANGFAAELARRRAAVDPDGGTFSPVPVLSFDTLFAEAAAARTSFTDDMETLGRELIAAGHDVPEQSRRLTEFAWDASGRQGPAIVLGFASTPYLPVELGGDAASLNLEKAARDAAAAVSTRFQTSIGILRFFPGISDMSFLGNADTTHIGTLAHNSPAWSSAILWANCNALAGIPIVNAGPWGRDYHTRLERAHRHYTFEVLPALVEEIVRRVLVQKHPGE